MFCFEKDWLRSYNRSSILARRYHDAYSIEIFVFLSTSESPLCQFFKQFTAFSRSLLKMGASDVHIKTNKPAFLRLIGRLLRSVIRLVEGGTNLESRYD